jgi:hypothetical protein
MQQSMQQQVFISHFWQLLKNKEIPQTLDFTRFAGFFTGGDKRVRTADLLNAILF